MSRAVIITALVSLLASPIVFAGEASIAQIPSGTKPNGCALCFEATDEEVAAAKAAGIDYYVTAGPPNTHDIIQLGTDNVAIGISVGEGNYIGQFQFGRRNESTVGIIADDTSVAVVQDGNDLKSNLLVWGNPKAAIGVYQPPGSAPVNAAIFTAADGKQVIFPGNATTIIKQKAK